MTRRTLFFALALLVCCLSAEAGPLSVPVPQVPDLPSFLDSLQTPRPTFRSESTNAYCKVTLDCEAVPTYGSISCESYNSDCHAGSDWVECDGVRQNCPVCVQVCCGEVRCFGWSSCTYTLNPYTQYCDGQSAGVCRPLQCG